MIFPQVTVILRVVPHGTRAERKILQPSPRGCDGERI
jgi:hypothetical protein